MFQKNLEAIRINNPALAARLEGIDISKIKDIEVIEAESGDIIISYKKTPLHNSLDPIREAKTTWHKTVKTELKKNDIQLVFGFGLGYLFKRAFISSESKIILFEPIIEILRYVFEYVDFSAEFSEGRVFLTDNLDELLERVNSEFLTGDRIEFLFLNSYAAIAPEMLLDITRSIVKICEAKGMDQDTIINQSKFWAKNSILNMPYFPQSRPMNFLNNTFEKKAALIVSAGPSLMTNIQLIKENRDKFIVIAVAQTLKLLLQEGINPDFAVFTDSNYLHYHIEGIEDQLKDTALVLNTKAESDIIQNEFKYKLLYFTETDAMAEWFRNKSGIDIELYKSGGTTSILCYHFAKVLGCDPIIFTGLDLAFIDNKMYATGEPIQLNESGNICVPGKYIKKSMYVKGNNGEMLLSRDDYALFIRNFEEIFTHNTARIINTSTSGALINGIKYMEFTDAVSDLPDQKYDKEQILNNIFTNTMSKWNEANVTVYNELTALLTEVKELDNKVKNVTDGLKEVCSLFETPNTGIDMIQEKIESLRTMLNESRDSVVRNVFIATYLQNEIWEYARKYNTSVLPSAEDIKANMKLELDFFNIVCWATDNISKWLEETLQKYEGKIPVLK